MSEIRARRRDLVRLALAGWLGALAQYCSLAPAAEEPLKVEGSGGDFEKALYEAISNAAQTVRVPDGRVDWKLTGIRSSTPVVAAHRFTVTLEVVKR